METIVKGNIRIQLLSEDVVRIEYAKKGRFCDENTFFIPNKTDYSDRRAAYTEKRRRKNAKKILRTVGR